MFVPGRAGSAFTSLQRTLSIFQRSTGLPNRAYHGHFSSMDGRLWKRKLDGMEDFVAAICNAAKGFGHGTVQLEVKPTKQLESNSIIIESVRKAWIRLRFSAPMIALRTDSEPGNHGEGFFSSYECPKDDATIVSKWADETLKWHPEQKTLAERDLDLKDVWWGPGDNHWVMEMHVGRLGGNIQLILMATHWAIDGTLGVLLADRFLEYLVEELERKAEKVEKLSWGEEIVQLPPSMAAVIAPQYRGEVAPPLQMDGIPNFFHRPVYSEDLTHSTSHTTLSYPIQLTTVQTRAFRDNCKAHGFTVTPALNAILVLADVETALKTGIRKGTDAFKEVQKSFLSADGFFIPVNGANRRSGFLPEHASLDSPLGTPGMAAEAFPTVHDMNPIRKCIRVDGNMKIERIMSQDAFWNGAVMNAHDVLAPGKPIPPHLLANQKALNAALASRTLEVVQSGILATSIGDFDKANILARWKPSNRNSGEVPALTIENMILSARMTQPTVMCSSWQYDGRLTMHIHGAREFHDEHAWQDFADAVESRLYHVVENRF